MARRLCVYLNGRKVGNLDKQSSGAISFTYDAEWLDWRGRVPVSISLPLRPDPYRGDPVVNVFENLLPDTPRIRRNVAERLGADGTDAFSLLDVVGRDCVGALQFLREGDESGDEGHVEGDPLEEAEIAKTLRQLRINPLGLDPEGNFRLSIAGAQDKTALLKFEGRWLRPIGSTPTTHILKPAMGMLHNEMDMTESVQNEFVCLNLCKALGLDVAEAEIARFEDQLVLSVTRFDRLWTDDGRLLRLPQEDFCQALSEPSTRKYQSEGGPGMDSILERLGESNRPVEDRLTFVHAQMIFWLIGATDGHAKNFSIQHTPGGGFVLAPIYDVLSAQPVVDAGRLRHNRYKLAMSAGDNNRYLIEKLAARHFDQTADAAGLPKGSVEVLCEDLGSRIETSIEALYRLIDGTITEPLIESLTEGLRNRAELLRIF